MHYEGWIETEHTNSLEQGFRMGGWRVRPHAGELCPPRRFSFKSFSATVATRHVEPKAMRVLLVLAARTGEFVSKDELIRHAWDGRAVSDDALTHAIHGLRAALDDDARDPRYIETRSNVGYRLLVPVKPTGTGQKRSLHWPAFAMAALVFLGALTLADFSKTDSPVAASPTTIAVLPFLHLSDTASDDYLAAAMMDSLILKLAQLPGIRVISRTSVMPFGDQSGSAESIARQLGADLLIEGSVQTTEDQVRVVAQLIEPYQDKHLWAQHFDRPLVDVLALQQEISMAIAVQIGSVLATEQPTPDPLPAAAMQDYLQARYLLAQEEIEPAEAAEQLFQSLTEQHPDFAPAYLGKAQALLYLFKKQVRSREDLDQGLVAAEHFESLAGASAESHSCIGQAILLSRWDFEGAELRYRAALSLNPSDTIARRRYAWLLVAKQEYEPAAAEIRQIRLLDPLYYDNAEMAALMLYSGDVDAAIDEFERLDQTSEVNMSVLRAMGMAYLAGGRDQEAHQSFVRMLEAAGNSDPDQVSRFREMTSEQLYRQILEVNPFRSPIVAAGFQNLLGNTAAALADLEQAVMQRDPYVLYLGALPELASLHENPRFVAILDVIGVLPENHQHLLETRLMSANISNPQTDPHEN